MLLSVPAPVENPELEKQIAARLRQIRKEAGLSRVQFARRIGCDNTTYANYEYGRIRIPFSVANAVLKEFNIRGQWLLTEQNPKFGYEGFERIGPAKMKQMERWPFSKAYKLYRKTISDSSTRLVQFDRRNFAKEDYARKVLQDYCAALVERVPAEYRWNLVKAIHEIGSQFLRDLKLEYVGISGEWEYWKIEPYLNKDLQEVPHLDMTADVRTVKAFLEKFQTVEDLIQAVKEKAAKPGGQAELSRKLKVSAARVSEWLAGTRKPSGKYTLELLLWVATPEGNKTALKTR